MQKPQMIHIWLVYIYITTHKILFPCYHFLEHGPRVDKIEAQEFNTRTTSKIEFLPLAMPVSKNIIESFCYLA